jgi:hypothetical protein
MFFPELWRAPIFGGTAVSYSLSGVERFTTVTEETLGFFRLPLESYFPTGGLHFSSIITDVEQGNTTVYLPCINLYPLYIMPEGHIYPSYINTFSSKYQILTTKYYSLATRYLLRATHRI